MKVSLVVVCHHSSSVLPRCLKSFRREAVAAGVEPEVVAVEHSEDTSELATVEKTGIDRLLERPNRGYGAGLNAGAAAAGGDVLILANPDIFFFPGSVAALVEAIAHGFDVVGPQLVWDEAGAVFLPPAEDPAPRAELARAVRRRWAHAWTAGLSRALDESWRLWTAEETIPVSGLRGAVLTVSRETLSRLGPFDEGYFLYYEETEWLWRARRRGTSLGLAASAKVQHRWGHATGRGEGGAGREEASRRRFLARNYGGLWRRVLRASSGRSSRPPMAMTPLAEDTTVPDTNCDLWLASPFPHLLPALGTLRSSSMPSAFLDFCRAWRWVVAAATRTGGAWRIVGAWSWGR